MHARARRAAPAPLRWLGWSASVVIALLVAPLPIFLLELRLPPAPPDPLLGETTLAFYFIAFALGAISVALVAVPGLVLLRLARRDGLKPRLLLGVATGLVAATCGLWAMSGDGAEAGMRGVSWPVPLYVAIALGLLGGFLHWHLNRWLPGGRAQVPR
jgi:hypothetical protein